jgi:hypothetical protein
VPWDIGYSNAFAYQALSNGTIDQAEAVSRVRAWRPRVVPDSDSC